MKEKKDIAYTRFVLSMIPPAIIVLSFWLVKIIEVADHLDLFYLGIFPRKLSGAAGILLAPFIHANFAHLANNSVPFLFLLAAVFFFYQHVAWRVLFLSWLLSGILVWLLARPSYHIGASGLVYAFASFLFFSGIVKKNIHLTAISLLVAFLYGSLVWGIFPYKPDMSWESHLMGLVMGLLLAFVYRQEGPGPTQFMQDLEDDPDEPSDTEIGATEEEKLP